MTNTAPRFLADYQPSNYSITTVNLTVTLDDTCSEVISELSMLRNGDTSEPLRLNGDNLKLISLVIDGQSIAKGDLEITNDLLTIPLSILPPSTQFTVVIKTEVNPQENTALEGLFKSGSAFCTQCEASHWVQNALPDLNNPSSAVFS